MRRPAVFALLWLTLALVVVSLVSCGPPPDSPQPVPPASPSPPHRANEPGNLLWSYQYKGAAMCSSATVIAGVAYVGSADDYIYALDAPSGEVRWRIQTGNEVCSTPAVADGVVYVGSRDHHVYALDAASGLVLWRFETGDEVWSSPAVADGVVYVGSRDHYVYALDAERGALLWRHETGWLRVFLSCSSRRRSLCRFTFLRRVRAGRRGWCTPLAS